VPQRLLSGELSEDDLERARTCVAVFFQNFSKQELLEKAIEHRLLCAPIATTADLLESRQLEARQFFQDVTERSGARRRLPGAFAMGADEGFVPLQPAPALGEHSAEVLKDWLGLGEDELARLYGQGAIL
jgi:crotonobetainyl-CoA:carnitine CoA-transferase CaiB-like acyl-CoA transferase